MNNNFQINTKDLRGVAVAWQAPALIKTTGHEIRSFIWLGFIFFLMFGAINVLFKPRPSTTPAGPSLQEISNFKQAVHAACIQELVARGHNKYTNSNCREIATVATYNRFGRSL